jgi:hypothetical protein
MVTPPIFEHLAAGRATDDDVLGRAGHGCVSLVEMQREYELHLLLAALRALIFRRRQSKCPAILKLPMKHIIVGGRLRVQGRLIVTDDLVAANRAKQSLLHVVDDYQFLAASAKGGCRTSLHAIKHPGTGREVRLEATGTDCIEASTHRQTPSRCQPRSFGNLSKAAFCAGSMSRLSK